MEIGDLSAPASVSAVQADAWGVLADAALPSLRLTHAGECDAAGSGTRLGGVPLVAPGFDWPETGTGRPLSLIGQLDSSDINTTLGEDVLPAGMLLAFFYDADQQEGWGFDPAHTPSTGGWSRLMRRPRSQPRAGGGAGVPQHRPGR